MIIALCFVIRLRYFGTPGRPFCIAWTNKMKVQNMSGLKLFKAGINFIFKTCIQMAFTANRCAAWGQAILSVFDSSNTIHEYFRDLHSSSAPLKKSCVFTIFTHMLFKSWRNSISYVNLPPTKNNLRTLHRNILENHIHYNIKYYCISKRVLPLKKKEKKRKKNHKISKSCYLYLTDFIWCIQVYFAIH